MFCYSSAENEANKENFSKKDRYMKDLKSYRSLTLTSNFKSQIQNVAEEEESSPLNSWFRTQGGSSHTTSTASTTAKTAQPKRLPKLPTKMEHFSGTKSGGESRRKSSRMLKTSGEFNSISLDTFNSDDKRTLRTPQPVNSFYLKCIEDVIKSNQPQTLVFESEPTELMFVNREPFFNYVTFGTGRSLKNVWKIDRKPTA